MNDKILVKTFTTNIQFFGFSHENKHNIKINPELSVFQYLPLNKENRGRFKEFFWFM